MQNSFFSYSPFSSVLFDFFKMGHNYRLRNRQGAMGEQREPNAAQIQRVPSGDDVWAERNKSEPSEERKKYVPMNLLAGDTSRADL